MFTINLRKNTKFGTLPVEHGWDRGRGAVVRMLDEAT